MIQALKIQFFTFPPETERGDFVFMQGMEMGTIPVPRHFMSLYSELVQGIVPVGVRPELPVDIVGMIWVT